MIACEQVGYEASDRGQSTALLVRDISFEALPGSIVVIRGPSGAGKSTLLSILACVRRPTSGQVVFDGQAVSRYTAEHRDRLRRTIAFVPQQLYLFDDLTAVENVYLPLLASGVDRVEGSARAAAMLDALEIEAGSTRAVRSMSGGERQRVAIARALVTRPRVAVLDEPTAHQDDARVRLVLGVLEEVKARQGTVVVAAHDTRLDGWSAADRTLRLEAGQLAGEAR